MLFVHVLANLLWMVWLFVRIHTRRSVRWKRWVHLLESGSLFLDECGASTGLCRVLCVLPQLRGCHGFAVLRLPYAWSRTFSGIREPKKRASPHVFYTSSRGSQQMRRRRPRRWTGYTNRCHCATMSAKKHAQWLVASES